MANLVNDRTIFGSLYRAVEKKDDRKVEELLNDVFTTLYRIFKEAIRLKNEKVIDQFLNGPFNGFNGGYLDQALHTALEDQDYDLASTLIQYGATLTPENFSAILDTEDPKSLFDLYPELPTEVPDVEIILTGEMVLYLERRGVDVQGYLRNHSMELNPRMKSMTLMTKRPSSPR
jgi:hypothetical protein